MLLYLGIYICEKYSSCKVSGISALLLLYKMRTPESSYFLFWLKGHQFLLSLYKLGQLSVCRKTAEDLKF